MSNPRDTSPDQLAAGYYKKAWFAEAAVYYQKAESLPPEDQKNLADALINLGHFEDALSALQGAKDGEFLKGKAFLRQGDSKTAVTHLKKAREKDPENPEVLSELALALHRAGETEEAHTLFSHIREAHPDFFETLFERANLYFNLKLFDLSKEVLERLEKIARKDADIFYRLGMCYTDLNLAQKAEAVFKQAIRWHPKMEYYRELASVSEKSNQIDKALLYCQTPLSRGDDNPYLRTVLAKCLLRKGDLEGALSHLEPFAARFEDPDIRAETMNTLGRIYHAQGAFDKAFEAFLKANEAAKESPAYKELDLEYPFKNAKGGMALIKKGLKAAPKDSAKGRPRAHVFFMGFPRSGTTLVQTILKSHGKVVTIDEKPVLRTLIRHLEDFPGGYPAALATLTGEEIETLRDIYFLQAENFVKFDKDTTLVDKMPLSTLNLPLILTLFPDAKILFGLRNPYAACLSCLMQNFNLNNAMGNMTDLPEIVRFYDLVMGFWKTAAETLNFERHVVRYEDLIADLEGEAKALCEFLSLPFDPAMLDYAGTAKSQGIISTPSYAQVVKPIYQEAREAWRDYRTHFEAVSKDLDKWRAYFGYEVD